MRGLTVIWDYQCVPKMLDLLQDPSPQVRHAAGQSVAKLMSTEIRFDANAPVEARAAAAKDLRNKWQDFVTKYLKSWQRRLEERDKNR